jgi:hypothetical protein
MARAPLCRWAAAACAAAIVHIGSIEGHWRELAGPDRFDVMCQTMQALLHRLTGH